MSDFCLLSSAFRPPPFLGPSRRRYAGFCLSWRSAFSGQFYHRCAPAFAGARLPSWKRGFRWSFYGYLSVQPAAQLRWEQRALRS